MASVKQYIGTCECGFSKANCSLASSSSSLSLGSSPTDSGKQRGMLRFSSVGEDKATMFFENKGPLHICPRWYELPFFAYVEVAI